MTDVGSIIDELRDIPHFRAFDCSNCGSECRVHALQIYCCCPNCNTKHKCRCFGAVGTELIDVVDAVLEWAGDGESFDAVMARRQQIIADRD